MSCGCRSSVTSCSCSPKGGIRTSDASARLAHRDGQKLTVRDLRYEQARDAALRRLHLRHQHGTWGIALGLTVRLEPDGKSVVVDEGYAVDALGRDLVLGTALHLPVAPVAGPQWMALVAEAVERKTRGRERPLFRWQPVGDVRPGSVIPLAAASVAQETVQGALDLRLRRYARKLVRPRIGGGATASGGTDWVSGPGPFLSVTVSTAEAGFLAFPRYFAVLEPPPEASVDPELVRPLAWIASTSVDSFTFQVAAKPSPLGLDLAPAAARTAGWSVSWLGVETWTGAAPLSMGSPTTINDVFSLLSLFGAGPIGGECL